MGKRRMDSRAAVDHLDVLEDVDRGLVVRCRFTRVRSIFTLPVDDTMVALFHGEDIEFLEGRAHARVRP